MIFPQLKNKKFGYVNLDTEAKWWLENKKSTPDKNALLDIKKSTEMILDINQKYNIDFSYGGWMEDRSFLWKGTYLEPLGTPMHLGVDINVSAGTEIAVDFDAEVVKVDDDYPEDGGWGPRVTVRHLEKDVLLVYAHLDREILCEVGTKLTRGQVFAKVGKPPFNGNWFPHLHVQTITAEYYAELEKNGLWEEMDGYGRPEDVTENSQRFPDPLRYISFT